MNTQPDPNLSHALHQLAEAPEPVNLADRALAGARGVRRRRAALTGLAVVAVAAVLAVPFALNAGGQGAAEQGFAAAPPVAVVATGATFAPCAYATSTAENTKEVSQQNWPTYVSTVIGKLPARTDYVMQSGSATVCQPAEVDASNAYAVINLGPMREAGHLTVNLEIDSPDDQLVLPTDCAALALQLDLTVVHEPGVAKPQVLFCTDGTASTPLTYGVGFYGQYTVTAAYPDHRVIYLESIPTTTGVAPTITAEQLLVAVTDPALVALIPVP
jgi:hypothetical protein